jgi:hypothetical protein
MDLLCHAVLTRMQATGLAISIAPIFEAYGSLNPTWIFEKKFLGTGQSLTFVKTAQKERESSHEEKQYTP